MSIEGARAALVAQLSAHRSEIEARIFARVQANDPDPAAESSAEYLAGLRESVSVSVDFSLGCIGQGRFGSVRLPQEVLDQARLGVLLGISWPQVMRRYSVGSLVLWDIVAQHVKIGAFSIEERAALAEEARTLQGALLDRFQHDIASEYEREAQRLARSPSRRRTELIDRLLAGRYVDAGELGYDTGVIHVGIIASGSNAEAVVRRLAGELGRRLLNDVCEDGSVRVWLGGYKTVPSVAIEQAVTREASTGVSLVVGEPAVGIEGFRITHRQAQVTRRVARLRPQPVTRYFDEWVVAHLLQDESMARSSVEISLGPLRDSRDGGVKFCNTLRAYFAAGHNCSAAAAALGANRRTVESRIAEIQNRLGRPLAELRPQLESALRLQELLGLEGAFEAAGSYGSSPRVLA
jgi:hypothetical protein